MKRVFAALLLLCAACEAPDRVVETPSGRPEGVFKNQSPQQVSDRVAQFCAQRGLAIAQRSSNNVVCQGELTGGDAIMAQMIIGNSYSTTPVATIRTDLFQEGRDTRAYVGTSYSTQMPFGQVNTMQAQGNGDYNGMIMFLQALGAEIPQRPAAQPPSGSS